MLDNETKRRIDEARDILVGKLPDPKSQVEQITIALIYKFMYDMDKEALEFGGEASFFSGEWEKYSWTKIFDPKIGGHEMLNLYGEAIVKLNQNPNIPQLFRDIFKNAYLPYRDPETLKLFLKTINGFHYDHSERLGDAFEYLLSVLGSQGDAGQFRTPRHIINFIVAVLQPKKNETICDPACGTAGFLISSYKYVLEQNTKKSMGDLLTPDDKKKMMQGFVGYDISPDMVRLSLVNMYLHNFTTPRISEYDTLTSEDRWNESFDIILANPPFMSPKGGIKPHKKFTMQANRSEVLFVDYIAEHINPATGRAGVIVPEGIIFQSANAYKQLRQLLVDKRYLYAVVSLPAGIFQPYSGVKTSILLMDKTLAKATDDILFVKIENDGFDLGAQRRAHDKNDLTAALVHLQEYKGAVLANSEFKSDNNNVFVVDRNVIKGAGDYNLSIDRYRTNENLQLSNFEIVKLGDICEFTQGVQVPQDEQIKILKEGYKRYLYISDFLHDNKLVYVLDKYPNKEVTENDLIMVNTGNTSGKLFLGKKGILSNNLFKISFKKEEILSKYLYYFISSESFYSNLSKFFKHGAQPHLGHKTIGEQEIPLPPLSFQQQMVDKIETYQAIINGAKQVVQNYKPQIDIDPNSEMVELGDVCDDFRNGVNFSKEQVGTGTKFVNIKDLFSDGYVDIAKLEKVNIQAKEIERYKLKKDDLLFVRSSVKYEGVGFSSLVNPENENLAFCGFIIKCSPQKERINPKYLLYLLRTQEYRQKIVFISNKANITNISQENLKPFKIPLLPLTIQQEIVSRLEHEQHLVNANKELIKIYDQKIKDVINQLWQPAAKEYKVNEPTLVSKDLCIE